jgi:hypothetical protein
MGTKIAFESMMTVVADHDFKVGNFFGKKKLEESC